MSVAVANLVTDGRTACGPVRNVQQRLGQACQRYAFPARQREFLDETPYQIPAAGADFLRTELAGEVSCELLGPRGERA